MPNGTVNPYEYYRTFSDPYSTSSAYTDIGMGTPSQEFLGTEALDAEGNPLGVTYASMIPEYDPYAEELYRTKFSEGVSGAYQSSVGELGGIASQARLQSGATGFAGGGAIGAQVGGAREDIQRGYGQAFKGALLDLTSGIRGERISYQDQLATLLTGYQGRTDYDIFAEPSVVDEAERYSPGDQFGTTGFFFPQYPNEGDTIKAIDGNTYTFTGDFWEILALAEGTSLTPGSGYGKDIGGGP